MNFRYRKASSQIKILFGLLVLSLVLGFQNCSKAHLTSEGDSSLASSDSPGDTTGSIPAPTATPSAIDPCLGSPAPGTTCAGGAIYLGILQPGARAGSATDKYMTTPGGCGEIPSGQRVGSGSKAYPSAEFTPTCSDTDFLTKNWNDGSIGTYYDIPGLTNYADNVGVGFGDYNSDQNYGSTNTSNIVAITASTEGGRHAAASYCENLVYGGYNDWYLPNRYELNLMDSHRPSIPGLVTGVYYWSSTEMSSSSVWKQRFSDGSQDGALKDEANLVRCVRRY
jgi:hypothetical protein